ncbi:MAG: protein-L-isoaspartate(D-aspartate) O-methyltransferase [Chloroflexi bacterium]|nr:protein-L-isoaspartate(D-aspartate) O-methyltransferase [Ktedonobacteraceae bacterium]MBV8821535.1 protein-L-isoaspartate(D-aspartate) O-methyltransferase [Ktedonobacteraceae bacterium]MBV9020452.1 protein-L-isoaspartate(D-aspartate) O-methyltransferase [Ktedonobacteraceae bacterium]MBV9707648.1 protein-L-isoaspartate(D-aspartate) O-methyltransferase [Chloroflexota bacterium]
MSQEFVLQRQQLIESLIQAGIRDEAVLRAMASTAREQFVDQEQRDLAYADRALPILMGQTISQPLMVAVMTQALQLSGSERVLEIGTGSGYQTAVLAHLAAYVYSVERYQQLSYVAALRLVQAKLDNISLYVGDGSLGWLDEAPYERIIVTAAAPEVPPSLVAQLAMDGLLVIPVGSQRRQDLLVIRRTSLETQTYSLGSCVFVPLVGVQGWHPG